MKIATYNIQNLFFRDKKLVKENRLIKQDEWNEELELLFLKKEKTIKDFERMRALSTLLGFNKAPFEPYVSLKNLEGNLMIETYPTNLKNKAAEITNWNGWIELATNPINKNSIFNKARVVLDTAPDILFLQEVESRSSLLQFNDTYLKEKMKYGYSEIFFMNGNENNGTGMGVLLKEGYRIMAIRSFSNERDLDNKPLFEKNVLQFKIMSPIGNDIYFICCQLAVTSDERKLETKRKRQTTKIASIYTELKNKGNKNIVVLGNFNAPSYSDSLIPLIQDTDLKDIVKQDSFEADLDHGDQSTYFRMGAYRKGINIKQKDYLLVSPSLFYITQNCGLNRMAVWPSKLPQWPLYDSVKNELDSASEHPLLWADIRLEDPVKLKIA